MNFTWNIAKEMCSYVIFWTFQSNISMWVPNVFFPWDFVLCNQGVHAMDRTLSHTSPVAGMHQCLICPCLRVPKRNNLQNCMLGKSGSSNDEKHFFTLSLVWCLEGQRWNLVVLLSFFFSCFLSIPVRYSVRLWEAVYWVTDLRFYLGFFFFHNIRKILHWYSAWRIWL